MASLADHLLLAFLLLTGASLQTQARESQFFSKTVRYEPPKETTPIPNETPAAAMMEEPMKFPPQGRNGYGLYGRGREQLPPTTTTTNNYYNNNRDGVPSRFPNNKFAGESYESDAGYGQNNYYNNNDDARYRAGNVPSKSEITGGSYENMESSTRYRADPSKPYRMSDTRYVENGRYSHDVRYPSAYEPAKGFYEGFGVDARGSNYGAKGNGNEYSNGMEGNQSNQENQESSEEYVP